MKFRFALILLAVTALALGLFLIRNDEHAPVEVSKEAPIAPTGPRVEDQMRDAIQAPEPQLPSDPGNPKTEPQLTLSREKLDWEKRIEDITDAKDLGDPAKSRRLFSLIASLPENGLTAAAEEAVKRLPDEDYDAIALPMAMNPQTHGLVESVLFADLMRRPDAITLPALLRIARIPDHPYAKFAHDNLDLLIGEDFGADWSKWEIAVKRALAAEK